jgi:hypothetical protein
MGAVVVFAEQFRGETGPKGPVGEAGPQGLAETDDLASVLDGMSVLDSGVLYPPGCPAGSKPDRVEYVADVDVIDRGPGMSPLVEPVWDDLELCRFSTLGY